MSYRRFSTSHVRKQHSQERVRAILFKGSKRIGLVTHRRERFYQRPALKGLTAAQLQTGSPSGLVCSEPTGTLRMVQRLLWIGILLAACVAPAVAADRAPDGKLDRELRLRALTPRGHSRVIVRLSPGVSGDALIRGVRGTAGRRLASVGGQVAEVADSALDALARMPGVSAVSLDRRVRGTLERT